MIDLIFPIYRQSPMVKTRRASENKSGERVARIRTELCPVSDAIQMNSSDLAQR